MRDTRKRANTAAITALLASNPVLMGIESAESAMGLPKTTVLTSGPAMPFDSYTGGQRAAIIGGALYEGLAADEGAAVESFERGDIAVRGVSRIRLRRLAGRRHHGVDAGPGGGRRSQR